MAIRDDDSAGQLREDNESPFVNEFFCRSARRRRGLGEDGFAGEVLYQPGYAAGSTELVDPELTEEWGEDPAGEAKFEEAPNPVSGEAADEGFAGEESEDPEWPVEAEDDVAVEHFAISREPAAKIITQLKLPRQVARIIGSILNSTSEKVHEELTKLAAAKAGVPFDHRLQAGCRWPDVPCSRISPNGEVPDLDRVANCYENFVKYLVATEGAAVARYATPLPTHLLVNKKSVTFRSHEGDLQIWHSMALAGSGTNGQVRDRIVKQIGEWYERGRRDAKNGLFHVGIALHTIQDSFTRSHTWRLENGKIRAFQDYNAQDGGKHREADSDRKTYPGMGYKLALGYSTNILRAFKKRISFYPTIYNYLIANVYALAPEYASHPAGGTDPQFKKKKYILFEDGSLEADAAEPLPTVGEAGGYEVADPGEVDELEPEVSELTERVLAEEASSFEEETAIRWTKCFSQEDVERVRKVYEENASVASSNSGDRSSCIVMLNVALGQLLPLKLKQHPARSTSSRKVQMARLTTESIDKAMRQLRQMNFALAPIELNFYDRRNRTAGTLKPERLKESVIDRVLANADSDGCWFAYGMSVMDGYHSVLLLVDKTASDARICWLDQFSNGLDNDVTSSLDQRLTDITQRWWQQVMDTKHKGYKTAIRLWPLRKPV